MNIEDWLYTPLGCSFVKERLMDTRFTSWVLYDLSLILPLWPLGTRGNVPGSSCIDSACTEQLRPSVGGHFGSIQHDRNRRSDRSAYQQEVTNCIARMRSGWRLRPEYQRGFMKVGVGSSPGAAAKQQCVDLCRIRRVRWRCVSTSQRQPRW